MDQFLLERIVDLRAQPAYVHVDHIGAAIEIHVPDLLGDQSTGENFAGAPDKQGEEQKFLGSQIEPLAATRGPVTEV